MKKKLIFFLCGLLFVALAGCASQISNTEAIPSNIPANTSTNAAWGGAMCEANGFAYYVSAADNKAKIMRMEKDGSKPTPVTGEYYYISKLTSDDSSLYFVALPETGDMETIYRLPLNGGKEKKVAEGHVIYYLQNVKGRLYWEDFYLPSGEIKPDHTMIQIKSVNPDGSDLQTLLTMQVPTDDAMALEFLAAEDGLYYVTEKTNFDNYVAYSDIYHMDFSGKNTVKLNSGRLNAVDKLFYDEGKLYFLMQKSVDMPDSLCILDEEGKAKTILGKVGYFHQNQYCGISHNLFYYFVLPFDNGSSEHLFMDLHQFDLTTRRDIVILHNIEMGDPSVGTLSSVRGKSIKNDGVDGLYILGNDIYYSTYALP